MPGKLEYRFNNTKLGEFPLAKEVMTIGRADDNDIRIDNLAVSSHHAKLLNIFDDSFLEDLNSTNGTYVNGKAIDKHPLRHGDIITIGKHELRYTNQSKAYLGETEKTILIRPKAESPGHPEPVVMTHGDAPITPELRDLSKARLQILNGRSAGRELALVKESVKLGKSGSEIVQINRRPDGHFIVCIDAQDDQLPPRVNGKDIGAGAIKLRNHDIIEINRLKIEYYLAS